MIGTLTRRAFLEVALTGVPSVVRGWLTEEVLRRELEGWLEGHLAWCRDLAWAERFRGSCCVAGTTAADYLQRVVPVGPDRAILAGIRFYGGRLDFPFVDLVASTWSLNSESDLLDAKRALIAAFKPLQPRSVRCLRSADLPLRAGGDFTFEIDQVLVAGQAGSIAAGPPPQHSEAVALEPTDDTDMAARYVADTYAEWATQSPDLSRRVPPATREQLESCRAVGQLLWVQVKGVRAGLIAADRDALCFLRGFCIVEEILATAFRGRGYAAALQRHQIDRIAAIDPNALVFGTIDGRNAPSRATARRVGRQEVATYIFLGV